MHVVIPTQDLRRAKAIRTLYWLHSYRGKTNNHRHHRRRFTVRGRQLGLLNLDGRFQ